MELADALQLAVRRSQLCKAPPAKPTKKVVPIVADDENQIDALRGLIGRLARRLETIEAVNDSFARRMDLLDLSVKHSSLQPVEIKNSIIQSTRMRICSIVAYRFRVDVEDILSLRRDRRVLTPRQLAMYFCRKYTTDSLGALGAFFNRDHSTLIHACRQVLVRREIDPLLDEDMKFVERSLDADTVEEVASNAI